MVGGNRAVGQASALRVGQARYPRPARAVQWDSFRFWEALGAGCVAIQSSTSPKYGVRLPVMPVNWEHYIGVDFNHVDEAVDRIVAEPGLLERVAAGGRRWAMSNYLRRAHMARTKSSCDGR